MLISDVATSSYLLPIFQSLSSIDGTGGANSEDNNPFGGIEEKVDIEVFERNWRGITEGEVRGEEQRLLVRGACDGKIPYR